MSRGTLQNDGSDLHVLSVFISEADAQHNSLYSVMWLFLYTFGANKTISSWSAGFSSMYLPLVRAPLALISGS